MTDIQSFLLSSLLSLREMVSEIPESTHQSICSYVDNRMVWLQGTYSFTKCEIRDEMEQIWAKWPKYSGVVQFPVPAPDGSNPGAYFLKSSYVGPTTVIRRWAGPYGESRRELLEFMINELSK